MSRVRSAVPFLVPLLAFAAAYGDGLNVWFMQDDFAWLSLWRGVYDFPSLLNTLFAPMAQGTIRVLSERVYFMALTAWFGLDALPFRIVVAAFHAANLWLVWWLARHLIGQPEPSSSHTPRSGQARSSWIAALAPALWTVLPGLARPLTWTSAFNQVLCGFFLLAALRWFVLWLESGRQRHWWIQFALFLAGFGANELNVVYPGLAASWILCFAPRRWKAVLPLGAVSLAYAVFHRSMAPAQPNPTYQLYVDGALPATLWRYFEMSFTHYAWEFAPELWRTAAAPVGLAAAAVAVVMVAASLVFRWRAAWFAVLWFFAALAPFLPLKNHITDYYLTVPSIGIALLFALAVDRAWSGHPVAGVAVAAVVSLFGLWNVVLARHVTDYQVFHSGNVERLVRSTLAAARRHPGKMILFSRLPSDLYWDALNDRAFPSVGLRGVYLAPGAEITIRKYPQFGDPSEAVLPPLQTLDALGQGRAVVYAVLDNGALRNQTSQFHAIARNRLKPELSRRVEPGNDLFKSQLGTGWYPAENGYRWMAGTATLTLGPPAPSNRVLVIDGFHARGAQPTTMRVEAGGFTLHPVLIDKPDAAFHFEFPLPPALAGMKQVPIRIHVDKTITAADDGRPLGVVVGSLGFE